MSSTKRGMALPIKPPFLPMEAKSVAEIPTGPNWQYEPKWDGFRCVAFRDGDSVELQSKAGQSLTRYFPELATALGKLKADKFVLDGEIIVLVGEKLSFDDLLQRIHPAASRVAKLSKETPAQFVLFDLLVDAKGESLVGQTLEQRRGKLEAFATQNLRGNSTFLLSPATDDIKVAREWLKTMRGQLDGLIAKPLDAPYSPGERAMQKIKNLRTVDCVVGGFRYGAKTKVVGSLLLGLYDNEGVLHHVGFTSSIDAASRPALTRKLEALIQPPGFTGRAPGGPSRWSSERSTEWQPLRPELVVEVRYDHFTSGRFRHGTKLVRWRPDKSPQQCRMDQVEVRTKSPLALLRKSA
ncbi:MAG: ATP-dependent ligase [Bryobacterales bacterium]|jgi:ATP-dependent DNA ligase|nr:ATP-dependent ligase [Bryobacterales bacterium]